jgi:hypothetical protein
MGQRHCTPGNLAHLASRPEAKLPNPRGVFPQLCSSRIDHLAIVKAIRGDDREGLRF